jgi:hypothetical protein
MAENLFTNEEFKEIVDLLNIIRDYLPEDKAGWVWNNYKRITGSSEPQPCNCGSSAGHWKKAVDTLRVYVKENAQNYNA